MVAMAPVSASWAAAASASRNASGRDTWWSAGSMAMIPFGSRALTCSAASPTQGAVFRAQGSTMKFCSGMAGSRRRATGACCGPHTT